MTPTADSVRNGIKGAALNAVAQQLFTQPDTLQPAYTFECEVGRQIHTVKSDRTFGQKTVDDIMNQLFGVETLMIKGADGTRGFRF